MTRQNTTTTGASTGRVSIGAAALWASALVIMAMTITQASRLGGPGVAHAGNVSHVGDLIVLTADIGNNQDALLALDGRTDKLLVYGVEGRRELQFRGSYEVGELFTTGRQAATGRRR